MHTMLEETIKIAQDLIRMESVTPNDGGTLQYISEYLQQLGFEIEYINLHDVKNLYAKIGKGPYTCFAGHVDIVPPGEGWKHETPYSGIIENGRLYGRGANDMKTTIACAMVAFKEALKTNPGLSLAMLLTSDEEAIAEYGLKTVVPILAERKEPFSLFILGEPSAHKQAADVVKIGRRGSMTAIAQIHGIQGHIAYPELAKNPIPIAVEIMQLLDTLDFEDDNDVFGKSKLQLTNCDAKNLAMNVIPGNCEIRFGIRFNPAQNEQSIKKKVEAIFEETTLKHRATYTIEWRFNGSPFICENQTLLTQLREIIKSVLKIDPIFDGKGATSDGRFLSKIGSVVEIGFQEDMAHKVDESVAISDIENILQIYCKIFSQTKFFNPLQSNL